MVSVDEWVGDRYSGLLKKTGVWHSGLSSDHASPNSWRKESSFDDCAPKVRIKKPAESNGGIVFAIVASLFLAYVAKLSPVAPGLITVLMAFVGWVLTLVLVRRLVVWSFGLRKTSRVDRFLLVLGALAAGVVVVECWLHFADALNLRRSTGQGMPVDWQKRDVLVPGSKLAHYWHEILFVFDENGMRRTEPFPQRRKNVCRVVLDQNPDFGGRGYQIARFAEEAALEAGMTVVPTEEYYRQHDGERMSVSRWEGHPSSRAHKLFAELLLPCLKDHPGITSCLSSGD